MGVSERRGLAVVARSPSERDEHRLHSEGSGHGHGGMRYQFTFAELVSADTLIDFPELEEAADLAGHWATVLFGPVVDRTHLYELLHRCDVLGLTVIDLRVLPD